MITVTDKAKEYLDQVRNDDYVTLGVKGGGCSGFTYVWDFNLKEEKDYVEFISSFFHKNKWEIYYVELESSLEERLKRNKTKTRLIEKPSKRDTELSQKRLIAMDAKHKMNTDEEFYYQKNYLKIVNTNLTIKETVEKIVNEFEFN